MKTLKCIWVGRLKSRFWSEAAAHYLGLLGRWYTVREVVVRDAPAGSPAERTRAEGAAILATLGPADLPICLDERGEVHTSRELATLLQGWVLDGNRSPCFIVGGAYGLSETVRGACKRALSLSAMTLPHEMARVVLLEQLYRAGSILRGLPYHHD